MKRFAVCVLPSVLVLLALPSLAGAQDFPPPPPCCPRAPGLGADGPSLNLQPNLVISSEWLQELGLTRTEFVDRMAAGLFPGDTVHLLVTWTRTTRVPAPAHASGAYRDNLDGAASPALVEIEERQTYRFPRAQLTAAQLESLDELSLTNGRSTIKIGFTRAASQRATPLP